ncbi:hypothetical protein ES703_90592 [subsurface metagenome]
MAECCLCVELRGELDSEFCHRYQGVLPNRIITETENFVVVPSIGQIVEGYLLIVAKAHHPSMGCLSDSEIKELEDLMQRTRLLLTPTYGRPLFFEHGVVDGIESGGCGISHAHIHAVPLADEVDLLPLIQQSFRGCSIQSLTGLTQKALYDRPYLFYEDQQANRYLFDLHAANGIPSQYLRRAIASKLGSQEWDWRSFGQENKLLATLTTLKTLK